MDQILRHFRAEPFWFAFKTVSAALGVICLQQTGFFCSGLALYTGSFHPHTPPKPPPTPAPLVVKIDVDPLRPHPDFSNVHGIYAILNDTSSIIAFRQANVSDTIVNIMVTANSSSHCFPVNGTTTEAANTATLLSRMMTWLIPTGTNLLEFMLRRLADLAFFHNTSMSNESMACLAVPLTVIAAFVGYQGYLGVQHVREIYKENARYARREREREMQLIHLDEAVSLNLNKVALLEGRATRAEEAKEQLQQQYAEALRLKDASYLEASIARDEAEATKKAQNKAQQQSAEAEKTVVTALATANSEKDRLSDAISTKQAIIDQIRQENSELRSNNSSLQLTIERAETATNTAVTKAQKKSIQEIDSLKRDKNDRDDKLKTQNQTTTKLREEVSSMRDRLEELSPSSLEKLRERLSEEEHARRAAEKNTQVLKAELERKSTEAKKIKELEEKLRKQITDEQQLHKEAVDKITHLEVEMTRNGEAEKRRMSAEVETQDHLKKQVEEATRRFGTAEHRVAFLDAEKARLADVEAHIKKDLTTQVEEAVKGKQIAEDKNRLLETKMAQQTEKEGEVKRNLMIQVEQGVRSQDAAEKKTAVLEGEMGQVRQQLKTQVEEAVTRQKAAEEKFALLQTEMDQQAEAGADATRQIQEKLDASTRLLVELKGEMEELDTNFHQSVDRFEGVQAAKDATIKKLQAQLEKLTSTSSWTADEASTSPQGLDEPPQRPAVRLPGSSSDSATTENADTDDRVSGFPIKGAAGRQNSDGPNDSEAGKDGSNPSSSNFEGSGSEGEDVVNDGHNDLSQGSSPVINVCFCDNCGRQHAPPCKYFGPPYCANCGKNHPGKLNSCKKWCKQCQASHYKSDCPHTETAPHASSRASTDSAAVDTSNDLGNPTASSPAPPDGQGGPSPVRLPATPPVPSTDGSRTPGPQRGGHGAHRYTAPGLGPIRPSPGGFVPMPAAQRYGPSNGRGGGRGRSGQDPPLSAAESFGRQQRARGN